MPSEKLVRRFALLAVIKGMDYSQTSKSQVVGQQYLGAGVDGIDRSQVVGVGLYAVTLAGQWLAAAARWLVVSLVLGVTVWLTRWPIPSQLVAMLVAVGPLAASVLVLVFPQLVGSVFGRCWELACGGRRGEQHEVDAFNAVIRQLQVTDPGVRAPAHWFVVDSAGGTAAARVGSLRVDAGLLNSRYAPAVIAHQLGHLNSMDARLAGALNVLLLAPMDTPSVTPLRSLPFRGLAWVASGQAAFTLLARLWEVYSRSRELAADEYAARISQPYVLAAFLEERAGVDDHEVACAPFTHACESCVESRIARLRARAHSQPAQATVDGDIDRFDDMARPGSLTAQRELPGLAFADGDPSRCVMGWSACRDDDASARSNGSAV